MPRKPLLYTSDFPYHVTARSNNQEWFYIPIEEVWNIFAKHLKQLSLEYGVKIHAFVLMSNHYHLLLSTSEKFLLGEVMQILQRSVSRRINEESRRTNHVFGGPYKGSLVGSAAYYFYVLKYIYRNPVRANLCTLVEEYRYSTLTNNQNPPSKRIEIVGPENGIDGFLPKDPIEMVSWLNVDYTDEQNAILGKAIRKSTFKIRGTEVGKFL